MLPEVNDPPAWARKYPASALVIRIEPVASRSARPSTSMMVAVIPPPCADRLRSPPIVNFWALISPGAKIDRLPPMSRLALVTKLLPVVIVALSAK